VEGAADPAERAGWTAHVDACELCRREVDRFRVRRDRLGALLARADFPVPASAAPRPGVVRLPLARPAPVRPADRRWLRAAAAVLFLVAAAAMATPARAWIAEWLGERWAALTQGTPEPDRPTPAPAPAPTVPVQTPSSARVRFVPAGSELLVDVAHRQAAGAITLVAVDGEAAGAEVLGTDAVDLLVVPAGVRIRNESATSAGYRVTVPPGVRRVRLRVGGAVRVVARGEIGAGGWTMPLTR
jgi:hypothetical protein